MRHRASCARRTPWTTACLWFALLGLLLARAGYAQERGFRTHRDPPPSAGGWQFLVDRPWYSPQTAIAGELILDEAYRSLVPTVALGPGQLQPVLEHALLAHAALSLSLFDRLLVTAQLPVTLREIGRTYDPAAVSPIGHAALGDPGLGLRFRLIGHPERDPFSAHLGIDGWIPIGASADHQGDTGVRLAPRLTLAGAFAGRGRWAVDAGLLLRPYASLGSPALGLVAASEAQVGLAVGVVLAGGRLRLGPEARLSSQIVGQEAFAPLGTSLELLGGAKLLVGDHLLLGLSGGAGFFQAAGTPDARALLSLGWVPGRDPDGEPRASSAPPQTQAAPTAPRSDLVAAAPVPPAPPKGASPGLPAPQPSAPDASPASPAAPSAQQAATPPPAAKPAKDVAAQELALPPPPGQDADHDGIADDVDRCPLEPETYNGIRDTDGCPEYELPKGSPLARILTAPSTPAPAPAPAPTPTPTQTPAPTQTPPAAPPPTPAVPVVDSDGDGVPDAIDRCPVTAEDQDGFEDDDGCPEPDNDGDGIRDAVDACPLEAQGGSGTGKPDGCPHPVPDADRDGLPDDQDRCPYEPGLFMGTGRADGCPETPANARPALVRLLAVPTAPAASPSAGATPAGPETVAPAQAASPLASVDSDADGTTDDLDRCPLTSEDRDQFEDDDGCPEPDDDGDGIPDRLDKCPLEAETVNGDQDEDGCPDEAPIADADADGIPYEQDRCPLEPGPAPDGCPRQPRPALQLAGFALPDAPAASSPVLPQPTEGPLPAPPAGAPVPTHPTADFDHDGIPDEADACPSSAEDMDGFEDEDGCPDPDNDSDGIADRADRCPLEAETINGFKDDDGCPDPGPGAVTLTSKALVIDGVISFRRGSARLDRRGLPLLRQVALMLAAHPAVAVEIEGHTDDTGSAATNIRLSQARAEAIRAVLVKAGVAADRLTAKGYGPTRPRADNLTREGRELNRRVEFSIRGDGQ